jgi:hypothetical protein
MGRVPALEPAGEELQQRIVDAVRVVGGDRDTRARLRDDSRRLVPLREAEDGTAGSQVLEQLARRLPTQASGGQQKQDVGAALEGGGGRARNDAGGANDVAEVRLPEHSQLVRVEAPRDHHLETLGQVRLFPPQAAERLEQRRGSPPPATPQLARVDERELAWI